MRKARVVTTSERRGSLVHVFFRWPRRSITCEGSNNRVAGVRCGGSHRRGISGDMVRQKTLETGEALDVRRGNLAEEMLAITVSGKGEHPTAVMRQSSAATRDRVLPMRRECDRCEIVHGKACLFVTKKGVEHITARAGPQRYPTGAPIAIVRELADEIERACRDALLDWDRRSRARRRIRFMRNPRQCRAIAHAINGEIKLDASATRRCHAAGD